MQWWKYILVGSVLYKHRKTMLVRWGLVFSFLFTTAYCQLGVTFDGNNCGIGSWSSKCGAFGVNAGQYCKVTFIPSGTGSYLFTGALPTACPGSHYCTGGFTCPIGCSSTCGSGQYRSSTCTSSANIGCTPCAAGSFGTGNDVGGCTTCYAGQYQPSQGQSTCLGCRSDLGQYTDIRGATAYSSCPAGKYSTGTGCTPCAANTYSTGPTGTCTACSAGYGWNYYSAQGSTACTACSTGWIWNGAGCANCGAGYAAPLGATSCTLCVAGKFSASGAASCSLCLVGSKCPRNAMSEPEPCGANEYSPQSSISCSTCPAGSIGKTAPRGPDALGGCSCPATSSYWTGTVASPSCVLCSNRGGVLTEATAATIGSQSQVSLPLRPICCIGKSRNTRA